MVTLVVAMVLVLTTLAGFLGASWWVFDLLANLRPQQALVLGALAIGLLLLGSSRRVVALAVAGAIVNLALVVPFLVPSAPASPAADATSLDVTFLNVKIRDADRDQVIDYLRQRDDDLVVFATGTRGWVEALQQADLDLHVVSGPHRDPGLELIALARDPSPTVVVHQLTGDRRTALVEVTLQLDGKPVRVLATHPVSPLTRQRARQRDVQLGAVAAWASAQADPVVVLGDLNATPWSSRFRSMLARGGLLDSQREHGLQPTWPAALGPLGIPIDHVLHGPELTTTDRELGPSFGSDHRMVHATIARVADHAAPPGP